MFTNSCFISKNTSELREKLQNMGYEYHGKENITDSLSSLHCCNGWYYECNLVPLDYYSIADCGTNENLFLAVAALRDDTDRNQWFVHKTGAHWWLCTCDTFKQEYEYSNEDDDLLFEDWHKATVDELMNFFKSV